MQTLRKLYWGLTLCVLGMMAPLSLQAQLVVSGPGGAGVPASYAAMIQQLFGGGVVVSNLIVNCDTVNQQMGWFVGGGTNLNLGNGLLMTPGVPTTALMDPDMLGPTAF